jgi:hypothetical protein
MSSTITLSLSALVCGYLLGRWLSGNHETVIGALPRTSTLPDWAVT